MEKAAGEVGAQECTWSGAHQGAMYDIRGSETCRRKACLKHLGMVVREVTRVHGKAIVLPAADVANVLLTTAVPGIVDD